MQRVRENLGDRRDAQHRECGRDDEQTGTAWTHWRMTEGLAEVTGQAQGQRDEGADRIGS